ncbi:MAG: hypothetical protein RL637_540 [Pseudomonadota bacterium]
MSELLAGEISAAFGIKGWLKVISFTSPRGNILSYSPWILKKADQSRTVEVLTGDIQGKNLVARVKGINDRSLAEALRGYQIWIDQQLLPVLDEGEYYWRDLIGLQVENLDQESFGIVDSLIETGANDVLVVRNAEGRERLIPFVQGQFVRHIDLIAKKMLVDWDADF